MTTITHPLDALPVGPRDRRYVEEALDRLWDDPVSEYDLATVTAHPYGLNVYRAWEAARTCYPLSENPDWLYPIPSRKQVEDFLAEYEGAVA